MFSYPLLGCGLVFGSRVSIHLKLLDLSEKMNELNGIKMQIEDCAFQLIRSVEVSSDPAIAFKDIDVGIFLGGFPRKPGMERSELLKINNEIFR
jgi:malate/lactate dehydrogenase